MLGADMFSSLGRGRSDRKGERGGYWLQAGDIFLQARTQRCNKSELRQARPKLPADLGHLKAPRGLRARRP